MNSGNKVPRRKMIRLNRFTHNHAILRRLMRSMSVGAAATLIDFTVFALLHFSFGFPALAANTISYSAGSLNAFSMNRVWTYADRPRRALWVQFVQFLTVAFGALLINDLVIYLAPHTSLLANLPDNGSLAAKACASGMGMTWNFLLNHFWTFRRIGT
jgi:putative flippase GtrA